jgi:uncharacterized protein (DUF2147 family)
MHSSAFRYRKVTTFASMQKTLWLGSMAEGRLGSIGEEPHMLRKTILAAAAVFAFSLSAAWAVEPIEGNWKTQSGETAAITNCGGAYCVTLKTGKHSGKQIGKMTGTGDKYKGSITDPANDKTYSGSASISGSSMRMRGCVLGVLCKSQTWTKM